MFIAHAIIRDRDASFSRNVSDVWKSRVAAKLACLELQDQIDIDSHEVCVSLMRFWEPLWIGS